MLKHEACSLSCLLFAALLFSSPSSFCSFMGLGLASRRPGLLSVASLSALPALHSSPRHTLALSVFHAPVSPLPPKPSPPLPRPPPLEWLPPPSELTLYFTPSGVSGGGRGKGQQPERSRSLLMRSLSRVPCFFD